MEDVKRLASEDLRQAIFKSTPDLLVITCTSLIDRLLPSARFQQVEFYEIHIKSLSPTFSPPVFRFITINTQTICPGCTGIGISGDGVAEENSGDCSSTQVSRESPFLK